MGRPNPIALLHLEQMYIYTPIAIGARPCRFRALGDDESSAGAACAPGEERRRPRFGGESSRRCGAHPRRRHSFQGARGCAPGPPGSSGAPQDHLRTPAGGSSRQTIILVKGKEIKTRLLSGRETARLMGLPEDYQLPESYNETYHLTGDGLAVPVVSAISEQILLPILREHGLSTRAA